MRQCARSRCSTPSSQPCDRPSAAFVSTDTVRSCAGTLTVRVTVPGKPPEWPHQSQSASVPQIVPRPYQRARLECSSFHWRRFISRRLGTDSTLVFASGCRLAKKRARSPAVLTKPVAAATAFVALRAGITTRRPSGCLALWPFANFVPGAIGPSGVVSCRPEAETISRAIQAPCVSPVIASIARPTRP